MKKEGRLLRRIAAFALCLLLILCLAAAAKPSIPEPLDVIYAADFADVLSSDTEDYIVGQNRGLYEKTGAQIVVATVDFLDGAAIDEYALEMFNQWGIGSKEKNNGVLLLLAIGEDNYYCLQGKGLESKLSSGKIQTILDRYLEPDFAQKDYDAGARLTFDALFEQVASIYGYSGNGVVNPPQAGESPSFIGGLVRVFGMVVGFGLLIGLIVLFAVILPRRRRYYMGPVVRPPRYRPFYHNRRPPPPPPGNGPPPPFGGGFFGGSSHGGGGSSRGGGAGRSGGFFSGGSSRRSGGSSRPRSGGSSRGGGGSSRGGGAGRR